MNLVAGIWPTNLDPNQFGVSAADRSFAPLLAGYLVDFAKSYPQATVDDWDAAWIQFMLSYHATFGSYPPGSGSSPYNAAWQTAQFLSQRLAAAAPVHDQALVASDTAAAVYRSPEAIAARTNTDDFGSLILGGALIAGAAFFGPEILGLAAPAAAGEATVGLTGLTAADAGALAESYNVVGLDSLSATVIGYGGAGDVALASGAVVNAPEALAVAVPAATTGAVVGYGGAGDVVTDAGVVTNPGSIEPLSVSPSLSVENLLSSAKAALAPLASQLKTLLTAKPAAVTGQAAAPASASPSAGGSQLGLLVLAGLGLLALKG